jgi:CubicO group peptidase (beta-lactamase class C family)
VPASGEADPADVDRREHACVDVLGSGVTADPRSTIRVKCSSGTDAVEHWPESEQRVPDDGFLAAEPGPYLAAYWSEEGARVCVRGRRHARPRSIPPFLVDGAGYGGLVGPVTDAARFLQMHLNDGQLDGTRILAADTARQMRTIVARGRPFDHATGWFRRPRGHDTYVEHYGTGVDFWNVMRIYPEHDLGITIMSNSTVGYPFHQLMTAIADSP